MKIIVTICDYVKIHMNVFPSNKMQSVVVYARWCEIFNCSVAIGKYQTRFNKRVAIITSFPVFPLKERHITLLSESFYSSL